MIEIAVESFIETNFEVEEEKRQIASLQPLVFLKNDWTVVFLQILSILHFCFYLFNYQPFMLSVCGYQSYTTVTYSKTTCFIFFKAGYSFVKAILTIVKQVVLYFSIISLPP